MELEAQMPINKVHVSKRVKDWKLRVTKLYKEIGSWVSDKPEYKMSLGGSIRMYEELMAKYGLPPEKVQTADLYKGDKLIASFKPVGLWVIGANGRIDMLTTSGSYTIVDNADQFQAPKWHMYSPSDHRKGKPFSKHELLAIV